MPATELAVIPTAEVRVVGNQFDFTQDTRIPVTVLGQRLVDALPECVLPGGSWVVVENGQVLTVDEWTRVLRAGSQVTCYPRLGDATTRLVAGVVLTLA